MHVRRHPERSRYELIEDDAVVGVADFREEDDRLVFHHTEIVRPLRGTGRGATLVRGALDDVRREGGKTVVPVCWFVAEFFDLNPDYADLRAG